MNALNGHQFPGCRDAACAGPRSSGMLDGQAPRSWVKGQTGEDSQSPPAARWARCLPAPASGQRSPLGPGWLGDVAFLPPP